MCEEYNGWTNRETWATMLHIDNDQGLYEMAREYARQALLDTGRNDEGEFDKEEARYALEDTLQTWINEELLTFENVRESQGLWMMLTDIGSIYRVRFDEIAENLISNVKEEVSA